jgi:hypothetical protein
VDIAREILCDVMFLKTAKSPLYAHEKKPHLSAPKKSPCLRNAKDHFYWVVFDVKVGFQPRQRAFGAFHDPRTIYLTNFLQ